MKNLSKFDVIIIGGSYAGFSAAMSLGRSLRNVLIIDSGKPCNKQTPYSHNFITHDGATPFKIAAVAKEEVLKYPTITFLNGEVINAAKLKSGFEIETEKRTLFTARKLIFATGLMDIMPEIKGFAECWGISILHCPYCHGYEVRNQKTGIILNGAMAYEFTKVISNWTKDLTIFTNGKSTLTKEQSDSLQKHNILIVESEIYSFEHNEGIIKNIIFKDGSKSAITTLYAKPDQKQHCGFPEELGCEISDQGLIKVDNFQKTTVSGVYAAGDNCTFGRALTVAIGSGSLAGAFANKELIDEDF